MSDTQQGPCNPACTKIIDFLVKKKVPANLGIDAGGVTAIDGYRYLNIFVTFTAARRQSTPLKPIDLGVVFCLDATGQIAARSYVNLEANLPGPQGLNFIDVSSGAMLSSSLGTGSIDSYIVRVPVMGPFVRLFVYNREPIERTVTVKGYLVS